jgi:3-methyladenine DNA glycosylase AlkD
LVNRNHLNLKPETLNLKLKPETSNQPVSSNRQLATSTQHPASYIAPLRKIFEEHANPDRAQTASAYLRNQFAFYGLDMTLRRGLCKQYMKEQLPDYRELDGITKALMSVPERELHYFAIELTAAFRKQWDEKIIELFEWMIVTKSWWDTVDYISSECTGPYFKQFPKNRKRITGKWNRSDNFWLQRSSLLFQKNYKKETDTDLLTEYILRLAGSKEFFVQKAIGWVLREYSKTDAKWVVHFVKTHDLPALSKREALKRCV